MEVTEQLDRLIESRAKQAKADRRLTAQAKLRQADKRRYHRLLFIAKRVRLPASLVCDVLDDVEAHILASEATASEGGGGHA